VLEQAVVDVTGGRVCLDAERDVHIDSIFELFFICLGERPSILVLEGRGDVDDGLELRQVYK